MLVAGLLLLGLAGDAGVEAPVTVDTTHAAALADVPALDGDEVIDQYCTRCHSEQRQRGGLVLEGFTVEGAAENADIAERMIKKLRAGMMPPSGARRPEGNALVDLAVELESRIDEEWRKNPEPGTRVFQRLNRDQRKFISGGQAIGQFSPLRSPYVVEFLHGRCLHNRLKAVIQMLSRAKVFRIGTVSR